MSKKNLSVRNFVNNILRKFSKKKTKDALQAPALKKEDEYERKTPREHVLLRPGMYIGQMEPSLIETYVFNDSNKSMEKSDLFYSPGLLKIFDEILVNAADNKRREGNMTTIDITVNIKNDRLPCVSIKNNGRGVPITLHEKENIYIPELIFGHLLTGSNFNDDESRLTGFYGILLNLLKS
jgi:DNA topoisomerase-2